MTGNDLSSWLVSILRLGRGLRVGRMGPRPAQELILYEFEHCPYCRKVREVFSELDLDYTVYPCGRGSRHRAIVADLGGKPQFPYLVDPNQGTALYESEAIISHLVRHYGAGRRGIGRLLAPLNTLGSFVASAVRPRSSRRDDAVADRQSPELPLVLYGFEASPYCRKVREALLALDLPYQVRNVAKRSPSRPALVEEGGRMMVPFLMDPNTGTAMYESDDIVRYLESTYGRPST